VCKNLVKTEEDLRVTVNPGRAKDFFENQSNESLPARGKMSAVIVKGNTRSGTHLDSPRSGK